LDAIGRTSVKWRWNMWNKRFSYLWRWKFRSAI